MNFFAIFLSTLSELMMTYSGIFQDTGIVMFRGISTIMLVWFGVKSALGDVTSGDGFRFDKFASLVLSISFCYFMVYSYSDFYHLFTDMGKWLSIKIASNMEDDLIAPIANWMQGVERPSFGDGIAAMFFFVVYLGMALLQAVIFLIIGLGYLVQGVLVLLGPIFIPFFLVPKFEWLFQGWIRSLIQYTFYPVVANAFVYVISRFFSASIIYEHLTVSQLFINFIPITTVMVIGIVSVYKIPSIVNNIFTGRAGN